MSWTRTLFVAEGRIQPAGFDELGAGVHTQHRQRLLLSEAFQLAHRAGAEPAVSSCRSNEETLHISEPQAQVRATQTSPYGRGPHRMEALSRWLGSSRSTTSISSSV